MPVTATCPQCQATYKLPEAVFGKSVRCKKCAKVFIAGKAPAAIAAKAAADRPVAKKTMMADDVPETKTKPAARVGKSAIDKAAAASPVAPRKPAPREEDEEIAEAAPVRKAPKPVDDDDEIVEAVAAAPRKPVANDDEAIVEVTAAAPRALTPPGMKTPPPPARGPRDDDDLPGSRRRRHEEDDFDRPRNRRDEEDERRRPHERDDDRRTDDDFDNPDAPKKNRKGLFIGLGVGAVVLLGAVLVIFLLMGKGDGSDPRVSEHYTNLEREDRRHEAIAFFAAYAEPEKQDKMRSKVAQRLEVILKNRMGGVWMDNDLLVVAYCNWATAEQIPSMAEALEWNGMNRVSHMSNRKMLVDTLAKFKEPSAAAALVNEIRRTHFGEREAAVNALATMGDIGKKELVAFRFDSDHGLRMTTRKALETVGAKDADFLDAALKSLDDKDWGRRNIAIEFFRDFRDPPSDKAKLVAEKLMALANERHPFHSGDALNALGRWTNKDSAAFIAGEVKKADKNVNCEALLKSLLPYKDLVEVQEAFIKRLETDHHFERQFALKSVEDMGGPVASKAFLAMLNSHDGGMRNRARLMLAKNGVAVQDQIEQSIKDLTSAQGETRRSAAEFLAKAPANDKQREAVGKALTPMFIDEHWGVRDQVFLAMANWPSKDVYLTLYKLVNDTGTPDLRRRSMDAMAKIGDATLAPYIAQRLKVSEDHHHAAQALRAMGAKAENALHEYLLEKDRNLRLAALRILRDVGTSASLPALDKAAFAYSTDAGYINELKGAYAALRAK